ncbi:YhdP family protein [Vibrio sp. WJH972]
MLSRLWRVSLWTLTLLLLLLAIFVTTLRITLPHIDRYQSEIIQWINQQTQANLSIQHVDGFWRNAHPSISLSGLNVLNLDGEELNLNAKQVDIEFDLLRSIVRGQLVIADLTIYQLGLDASSIAIPLFEQPKDRPPSYNQFLIDTLDRIFLRQLEYFSVVDSAIKYQSITGETHVLAVEKLRWKNKGKKHFTEGRVSIVGTGVNSLHVGAEFYDHGSFTDLSGQFYLQANKIELGPWLGDYLKQDMGIRGGEVSFDAWIDLQHNAASSTYFDFRPSTIQWGEGHEATIQKGIIESSVIETDMERSWQLRSHSFALVTDGHQWPGLDINASLSNKGWRAELAQANIASLTPFIDIIPQAEMLKRWMAGLSPSGTVNQFRIAHTNNESFRYSAQLDNISTDQWALLPEVHKLKARVSGDESHAIIHATLNDDELPYGDVFQAPLVIENGAITFVWQKDNSGWRIWSDHISLKTPELSFIGEFRLDFPHEYSHEQSPLLSIYGEGDVSDVGQTWRYLPTRALGVPLTKYLSSALQGGESKSAQILWYGRLKQFPYSDNSGVFQAKVNLENGRYRFGEKWPDVKEIQLQALFENLSLNYEASTAKLMDVKALNVIGTIPSLVSKGHLDISANAKGDGIAIRDLMNSSPLANSLGTALTSVEIHGNVDSTLQLHIPFDLRKQNVRVSGKAKLKNNNVKIQSPSMNIQNVSGDVSFNDDVITAKKMSGELLGQPISFGFNGKTKNKSYNVNISSKGVWDVAKLEPYIGKFWIDPLRGDGPWTLGINLDLHQQGLNYQVDLEGDLTRVRSRYPYPLNKHVGDLGSISVQASGNQQTISARAQLPNAKYQVEIDISEKRPILTATNLVIGDGSFKPSPISGHQVAIRTDKYNMDDWIPIVFSKQAQVASTDGDTEASLFPVIPDPTLIQIEANELTAGTLEWHDADLVVKKQNVGWSIDINSQEAEGQASYIAPYDLSVALKRLHIYSSDLESLGNENSQTTSAEPSLDKPLVSQFDRDFHELIPNLTLHVDDFWLQGYKVGELNMDFQRQGNTLVWKNIDVISGSNEIHASGDWTLNSESSFTNVDLRMSGDNSTDLMRRFGITSGIQKAPFSLSSNLQWQGSPWSMKVNTLTGKVNTELGKGVVSHVSGAARLIGLFSLDSIIRKMQLDFSDVFDTGMAFNSIEGSGNLTDGVFVTNNITMDAVAGEMTIKGLVDLNQRMIDSEVKFVPDITSGIPVLSAFAVTPITVLYVFAITAVIAPVVEVFTEVNYSVTGPIDSPKVKEISRTTGEFTLPENMREQVKSQGERK